MSDDIKPLSIDEIKDLPTRDPLSLREGESYGPSLKRREGWPDDLDETGVRIDREKGYVDVYWGNYEYNIAFDRIDTPEKAFVWMNHLALKTWEGTTSTRLLALLDKCATQFGWERYATV